MTDEDDEVLADFRVGAAEAGGRVEKVLGRRLADASWDRIGKLLRQGRVRVEGAPAARGRRLDGGERVEVLPPRASRRPPQPNRRIRLAVLHEDAHLAVVVKPARLAVHPGPGHGTDTLLNALVARYPELAELGTERGFGLAHRLDRDTSGVLAVARTAAAYDGLRAVLAERRAEKEYVALVRGTPPEPAGVVDADIDGREARTRYAVEGRAGPVARLVVHPVTGRTHQIRIHLAGLGAPVLADPRYGTGLDDVTARLRLPRLALHARRLAFAHPIGGEPVDAVREPPRDLRRAWARAERELA